MKIKNKSNLEEAMKAQRERERVEVWLHSFLNLGARCGWVVNATTRPLYLRGGNPAPNVQEAWWAPRPVWTGAQTSGNYRIFI
jgi:hypothetical protein